MINEDKKTKKIIRQKLTESFIASIEGKEKTQIFNDEIPGLKLKVSSILDKSGNRRNILPTEVGKAYYYSYRPKGEEKKRFFLGTSKEISRAAAVRRMTEIKTKVFSGQDPFLIKQSLEKELTLGDLVKEFYRNRLNSNHGYKPITISNLSGCG